MDGVAGDAVVGDVDAVGDVVDGAVGDADVVVDVVGDDDGGFGGVDSAGCVVDRAMRHEPFVPEHQTWSTPQQLTLLIVIPRIVQNRNPDNNRLPCQRLPWWMKCDQTLRTCCTSLHQSWY